MLSGIHEGSCAGNRGCYLDCYWYILWEALNRQIEGAVLVVVLVYGADNLPANFAFPAMHHHKAVMLVPFVLLSRLQWTFICN